MVSTLLFERAQRLALNLAGIELVDRHRELLASRCRRLGILDSDAFATLLTQAENGDGQAGQTLLSLMTTKFTSFFRHPLHFDRAAQHVLEVCQQRGRASIWSAGAATGEEPWSLAMRLLEVFQHDDPPVEIIATDVDTGAIEIAEQGEYAESSLKIVEPARRMRFMKEIHPTKRWVVRDAVRRLVTFQTLNLADDKWPVDGPFDVIFSRNVLMYLEANCRLAAVERMSSLLAPEGLLMFDPAENLGKAEPLFTPGMNGIYSLRRAGVNSRTPMSSHS